MGVRSCPETSRPCECGCATDEDCCVGLVVPYFLSGIESAVDSLAEVAVGRHPEQADRETVAATLRGVLRNKILHTTSLNDPLTPQS